MERIRRTRDAELKGEGARDYFAAPKPSVNLIRTGCTLLDLILGGGWALGRVINIVGDKACGKTLLAIEAASELAREAPKARIWYCDAEAAFDENYARALGMPIERVRFKKFETVEDVFEHLESCIAWSKSHDNVGGLYVVDSLDALTDRKAQKRAIDDQGWHLEKPKLMSELFRKLIRGLEETNICLMIISQVRDNIGVTFGRKTIRSGGKALDFYASQIIYLAHVGRIAKTIKGQKRVVGVEIKAKCDKNKIGQSFRECDFSIRFAYGVDNLKANIQYLTETKRLEDAELNKRTAEELIASEGGENFKHWHKVTDNIVRRVWFDIETSFLPVRKKYE